MSLLTLFHRSDAHTINGLTANKLLTSQSGVAQYVEVVDPYYSNVSLRTTVSIYVRKADSTEVLIGAADIGAIDRPWVDWVDEGMQSVSWLCPETILEATDALKFVEKIQYVGVGAINTKIFVTEQLGVTRLNASVWTFHRYTYASWQCIGRLYYDTTQYNTRIEGISVGGAQFTDTFTRADSATIGNGWEEINAATHEILNNKVRSSPVGPTYDDHQLLRPADEYLCNGTISVDYQYLTSASDGALPGIVARVQGNNDQLYVCFVWGQALHIGKRHTLAFTDLAAGAVQTLSIGTNYRIIFTLDGSNLRGALYNVDTSTLLSTVSLTDTTFTNGGRYGVSRSISGTLIDFDNFIAARDITLVSIPDTGSGSDSVSIAAKTLSIPDPAKGVDSLAIDPSNLYLIERFDGNLDTWSLDESGGTIAIQTVDNDEKMVLTDSSSTGIVSATRGIIEPAGVYLIEADLYAATGAIGYLELLDVSENVVAYVKCDGGAGQGTFDTDASTPSTFTWAAASYKMVVLKVDTVNNTIRCFYTSGTGNGGTGTWDIVSAAKTYSGAAIAKIRFITDPTATGTVRVDEVKIYKPLDFALGDSLTAGAGINIDGTIEWNPNPASISRSRSGEDETHTWPYKYGQKYAPIKWCAERGVGGSTSAQTDTRVTQDVIDQGAVRCIILIGTNDVYLSIPLATTQANITSVTSKLVAAGVDVVLCSIPPLNAWDPTANANKDSLNSWISSHCLANGFIFVDVHAAVADPNDTTNLLPAYDAGDGIHFSHAGLQAVADAVYVAVGNASITENAAGSDTIAIAAAVTVTDSGTGVDSVAFPTNMVDAGVGVDAIIVGAYVSLTEAASATDEITVTGTDIYSIILSTLAEIKAKTDNLPADPAWQARLNDLHDEAFGEWVVDPDANTLTFNRVGGGVLKVFTLTPTGSVVPSFIRRTPQ